MAKEIANEYSSSLADLTVNSKPLINMLTMLAEENIEHAPAIVQVVEKHLAKVKPEVKLPVLYLIDSIVKNVGNAYVSLFTQNIVSTFCSVFEKVDEHTRGQMFKLRQTWNDLFPLKKLYAVDVRVNSMDPAWPITAPPPTSIHLNPRFLSMSSNSVPSVAPAQSATPQATQPVASGVQNSTPETGTGTEAQQALTEAQMREQLLRKQKELLELQQRKLELELLQTKARLEDQQRQLQVKEQQRQVEQNLLPSNQKMEDNTIRNTSNKSPVDQKKKAVSNKSVAQTPAAEEVDKTSKTNLDSKSARDPRLNRQQGSESGNFNYSGSNTAPHIMSEIAKSKIVDKNPVVSSLNKDPRLGTKDPRLNKIASEMPTHPDISTSSVSTTSAGLNPHSTMTIIQNPVIAETKRKPNFLPISSTTAKSQYPQHKPLIPSKTKKGTNGQVNNKGKPAINVIKTEEALSKNNKVSETISKTAKDEKNLIGRKGNDNRNDTSPRKSNTAEVSSHPPSPLKSDNHRPPRSEHGRKMLGKPHDTMLEKKDGRKKDSLFKGSSSKSPPTSAKGSPDSKRKRDRKKDGPGQRLSPRKSPSLSTGQPEKGSMGIRDDESENRTFKGLKNSRSRNYIRRNQESSRSPSPCGFPSEPSPNSSLKQMPTTESSSGTALVSKMMGDVDLRHCQTTVGGPAEKLPRLAVFDGLMEKEGKDEESKKLLPSKDSLHGEERTK
ncbi:hypothetical protein J437_LFUL009053, partial [Ladona fulva]